MTKRAVRPLRKGADTLERLHHAYMWALKARGLSPNTLAQQRITFDVFRQYSERQGFQLTLEDVTTERMQGFVSELLDTRAKATAQIRSRRMRTFFNWLVQTGEIAESPMLNMRDLKVPLRPPPVLDEDQLKRLVQACYGDLFVDIRDAAIIRLLIDTGLRRTELAAIRAIDIDWKQDSIMIRGKGGRFRHVWFGVKTRTAMERYNRERQKRTQYNSEGFWLSRRLHKTPFGAMAVAHIVNRRCYKAGIEGVSPHTFRHTFAHHFLANGGGEQELMIMGGWSAVETVRRYTALLAADRARDAQKRHSLGDRI